MPSLDKRAFLKASAVLGAGSLLGPGHGFAAPATTRVGYQLSWIKDFQFAGEYVADARGYYRVGGIDVDLMAGGANLPVDPVVMAGKALLGQSSPENTASANANGADLKIIGALYQRSPFCLLSLAKRPILSPRDMAGRKVGIQAVNIPLWRAFLAANHMAEGSVEAVPVQYDLSPLVSGEVDGFLGYANDDVVNLRRRGIAVAYFLFADHGYAPMTATFTVRAASLDNPRERALLVAIMAGDVRGWGDVLADPALGARLAAEVYGKDNGLDEDAELESCRLTADLMVSDATRANGLFWMTPDAIERTLAALTVAGVKAERDLFTGEILRAVHETRPAP